MLKFLMTNVLLNWRYFINFINVYLGLEWCLSLHSVCLHSVFIVFTTNNGGVYGVRYWVGVFNWKQIVWNSSTLFHSKWCFVFCRDFPSKHGWFYLLNFLNVSRTMESKVNILHFHFIQNLSMIKLRVDQIQIERWVILEVQNRVTCCNVTKSSY